VNEFGNSKLIFLNILSFFITITSISRIKKMNDSIFDDFIDKESKLNISFRNTTQHTFLYIIGLLKVLFSFTLFFTIAFVYLSRRQRYLQRRNITRQHRNYFIVNCTYISVVLAFATAFGLFSYYFPKITLIYICFKSRNLI
jgi:hypothetical protein